MSSANVNNAVTVNITSFDNGSTLIKTRFKNLTHQYVAKISIIDHVPLINPTTMYIRIHLRAANCKRKNVLDDTNMESSNSLLLHIKNVNIDSTMKDFLEVIPNILYNVRYNPVKFNDLKKYLMFEGDMYIIKRCVDNYFISSRASHY